jgi:50S ribosome-binding GTPase
VTVAHPGPAWPTPQAAPLPERLAALQRALALAGDRFSAADTGPARAVLERARQRLGRSPTHTVVALAGGTGSGKSSLFNAVVGTPLSPVGARRPSTEEPIACIWGPIGPEDPQVASLLDWLGIPPRSRLSHRSSLDQQHDDPELTGLILIDLPDHDTVRTEHLPGIGRVIDNADLVLWVVDPQKYADAALHERYLSRLSGRDAALAVVMNQLDRIEAATAATLGADLRRLLQEDGLGGAAVLAASAATGGGLPSLRKLLVDRVSAQQASVLRLDAELRSVVVNLRQSLGSTPHPVTNREAGDLVANLTYACAGDELVERLLADGRLQGPVVISENHVERAVSDLVEPIFDPLPLQWQRFGERLIDPRAVMNAVSTALSSLDVSKVGPSGLRRLMMGRERVEELRREAVQHAVTQMVGTAAGQTVLGPLAAELALWPAVSAALAAAL